MEVSFTACAELFGYISAQKGSKLTANKWRGGRGQPGSSTFQCDEGGYSNSVGRQYGGVRSLCPLPGSAVRHWGASWVPSGIPEHDTHSCHWRPFLVLRSFRLCCLLDLNLFRLPSTVKSAVSRHPNTASILFHIHSQGMTIVCHADVCLL